MNSRSIGDKEKKIENRRIKIQKTPMKNKLLAHYKDRLFGYDLHR